MGESWHTCDNCNEPMSDYRNDIVWCENCDEAFCSVECAEEAGVVEIKNGYGSSCSKCRGDVVSDTELLYFTLEMYGNTRGSLEQEYKEYKKDKGE